MKSLPSWCPPYSSIKLDPVTQHDVYCICKKPDEGDLMVGCDGCDDWFHFSCLKIPECYRSLVFSFYCPYCQAGITGKDKENEYVPLPKTLWKRKCRLVDCYQPCAEGSKYCSEEHGLKYMKNVIEGLQQGEENDIKTHSLIGDMLDYSECHSGNFKDIGRKEFIDDDIPKDLDSDIYEEVIGGDSGLDDLNQKLDECDNVTFKNLNDRIDVLNKYIAWVGEINSKLNTAEDTTDTAEEDQTETRPLRKRKRKGKKQKQKAKKNICGYSSNIEVIPCSSTEFLEEYTNIEGTSDETELHGICIKLKCNRHSDWSSVRSEQLQQQILSAESYKERLKILIKIRKRQLYSKYYGKLLEKHKAQGTDATTTAPTVSI